MVLKATCKVGLVLSSVFVIGLNGLRISRAKAQTPSTNSSEIMQEFNFLDWFRRERDDPGPGSNGISRGPICSITLQKNDTVWNTTPLFIWQGTLFPTIALRESEESLPWWRETAGENEDEVWQLAYTEIPLEPGKQYEWLFYLLHIDDPESPTEIVQFQVLESEARDQITVELDELAAKLELEEANEEEIALAKAEYFLEAGLLSDALQTVFAVSNPSGILIETQNALVQEICNSSNDVNLENPEPMEAL